MNARTPLYGILVGLVILLCLGLAWRSYHIATAGLPGRIDCNSQSDALTRAGPFAIPIAGTGSMVPFIPAAAPGTDRMAIVAYAILEPTAAYDLITPGALCIYQPDWSPGHAVIHQAMLHDASGWVMSGLNNAHSEPQWRVTLANFKGIVARVYVWPLRK